MTRAVAALRRARRSLSRWWDARTVRFRKVTRTLVLLAVTGVLSLVLGVATATASSPVGPHEATWHASLNSTVAVDLGPLGEVSLDSPVAPLGVTVVLGQIPGEADPTAVSATTLGRALSSDGAAYVALATHPELTIERGVRALADDALRRAGLAEAVLLCLVAAGRLATGGRLRDAVRVGLTRGPASGLLVATVLGLGLSLLGPALAPQRVSGSTLEVLEGTPVAEARVSGRAADVIQAYGPLVRSFLDKNSAFYARAEASLRTAWSVSESVSGTASVTASDGAARVDLSTAEPVVAPLLAAGAGGAGDAGASPTASATASASSSAAAATPSAGSVGSSALTGTWAIAARTATTAVLTTDLHCNLDMIALAGVLDEVSGADVHMDDGDLTMTGTDPEQVCVDALSRAVPSGVARVATIGNHDSSSTAERLRAQGWTVTDGTVEEVAGLRVLGDVDALRTTATGTVQRGDETIDELGARLAETTCEASAAGERVDVVLIHEPGTFAALGADGCAPLLVAGHVHVEQGMSVVEGVEGPVAELVSGAGKGGTSLGEVTTDAYLHVLAFDADGNLLGWRAVVLHTDASVTVGPWRTVPAVGTTGQGAAQ